MKHRLLRVRELLRREIGDVLRKDFTFENALVTVNDVDIAPDLRQANVFMGVIARDESAAEAIIEELNRRHGQVQKRVFSRVVLKYTPQLTFRLDRSVERGVRVVALMDDLGVPEEELEDEDFDEGDEQEDEAFEDESGGGGRG